MANAIPSTITAESTKRKKSPRVLAHMEIHPRMGGGHIVTHHYEGYEHPPDHHHFTEADGEKAMKHIATHAGLPHPQLDEQGESEPEPWFEHETRKKT